MIRVRDGDEELILTIDEFERRARSGELSPFSWVCIPALTDDRFIEARELPLFVDLFDPRRALFRRHFHLGRLPLITGLLALACLGLYLAARQPGDGFVTREVLLAFGAKARARVVDDGESWRLLVANLLHRDVVHLSFNLFALLNIGTVLEGVYRRGDYVLLLVTAGLSTMGASVIMSAPVTVGASGLVFGCLGAAVIFGLRFADVLPLRYRLYFGVVVVGYAAVMFYLGLQRPNTDNWGHAGGLAAGLVMGAMLEPRLLRLRAHREPPLVVARPWILATVLVVLVVAAGPPLSKALLRFVPYAFDHFGVVLERPASWAKAPDPLGSLAFGNGVDALTSLACTRLPHQSRLEEAVARFVDGELRSLSRGGNIGELRIDTIVDTTLSGVPARLVPFRFMGSDGPFVARAHLFSRGALECAFVLAHREGAAPHSIELLDEIRARLRFTETRAERVARAAVDAKPGSAQAHLDLAVARQRAGDVVGARAAYAEAAAHLVGEPALEGKLHLARAGFELELGTDLDTAQREAEAAWRLLPDEADAVVLVVDACLARKHDACARDALAKGLEAHPFEPRLLARDAAQKKLGAPG